METLPELSVEPETFRREYEVLPSDTFVEAGTIQLPLTADNEIDGFAVNTTATFWDGVSLSPEGMPVRTIETRSLLAIFSLPPSDDDQVELLPLDQQGLQIDCFEEPDSSPTWTMGAFQVQQTQMNGKDFVQISLAGDCFDDIEAICPSAGAICEVLEGCGSPMLDWCDTAERVGDGLDLVDLFKKSAYDSGTEVLDSVLPPTGSKEGETGGRWSIQAAPEQVALLPRVETTLPSTDDAGTGGVIATVGDVSIDILDKGDLTQDTEVLEGEVDRKDWRTPDATENEKLAMAALCGFAIGATIGSIPSPAALAWGFAAITTCWQFASMDTEGWIQCGFIPSGVTWGPTAIAGRLLSSLTLGSSSSDNPATTTTYFDSDGTPLPGDDYIEVWPGTKSYDEGNEACERAHQGSLEHARAAAEEYGSTQSGDDESTASINVEIALTPVPVIGDLYAVQDDLLWSPVHGLSVDCSTAAGCPTRLTITLTQCGLGTVKGGSPAEVTYTFEGNPAADGCDAELIIEVGGNTETVPLPLLVLNAQFEGAGDDRYLA